jgi:SAM-dependent methyltransferase
MTSVMPTPSFSPTAAIGSSTGSSAPALGDAWNEVAAELIAIPLALERVRYAAAIKPLTVLPKSASILEAGCGAGRILRALDAIGYTNLTGVEISQARLDYVRAVGPTTARLVCDDKVEFPDESFDAVVSAAVIEHVEDPEKWLAGLARVARNGAVVSLTSDTYIWRWLKDLGLYKTLQPLDDAIWPRTLIGWARKAGLELIGCGGFVNVPEQQWYFGKQLKRLLSLRRWYCKMRGIRRPRTAAPAPAPPTVGEVASILEALAAFDLDYKKDIQGCIWSYENYFWFRKRL